MPSTQPGTGGRGTLQSDAMPLRVLYSRSNAKRSSVRRRSSRSFTLPGEYTRYRHGPPHGFAPIAIDEHCSDAEHTGRAIISVTALYLASSDRRSYTTVGAVGFFSQATGASATAAASATRRIVVIGRSPFRYVRTSLPGAAAPFGVRSNRRVTIARCALLPPRFCCCSFLLHTRPRRASTPLSRSK